MNLMIDSENANNTILLLTDGQPNIIPPEVIYKCYRDLKMNIKICYVA